MGEVYLAYDQTLNRTVALKILSGEFSRDDLRRQRFKQEARAISALNHPNILTVHEIGESEDGWYIATEFVEGETLRDYLRDSPLGASQAVRIAGQIADALVAAHAAGIVHRDIKPENIMIRRDGYVKVLDFGLAKPNRNEHAGTGEQFDEASGQIVNTQPGMVMGSVRYMSPEQARGQVVDERTDIWSLGVVLYEMVTGRSPFQGATTSDTLAALIHLEPAPLARLAPAAPDELNRIIGKALQKEREKRYQTAKDFALDLRNLLSDIEREISAENKSKRANTTGDTGENPTVIQQSVSAGSPEVVTAFSTSSAEYIVNQVKNHKWQTFLIGVGFLAVVASLVAAYRFSGGKSKTPPFEKTQVSKLSSDGKVLHPAISPDGKYVAHLSGESGNRSLVVRQLATDSTVTLVPPTALVIPTVSFSPDGNYIFYTQLGSDYTLGTLYRIPTLGGAPKKIIEDVDSEVSFSPDGKQLAYMRHKLSEGGDEICVAEVDGENGRRITTTYKTEYSSFTAPAWSPDGAKLLVGAGKSKAEENDKMTVAEVSLADGGIKPLATRQWNLITRVLWLQDGSEFLLLARETKDAPMQIWRVAYPNGEVFSVTNDTNTYSDLGISSDNKSLVTLIGTEFSSIHSLDPETKESIQLTAESPNWEGAAGLAQLRDGTIIFTRRNSKDGNMWAMDADGKNVRQLTNESGSNDYLVASPDSRYIIFFSDRSKTQSLWRIDANGQNPVQITTPSADEVDLNPQVTPDGKTVIFQRLNAANKQLSMYKISIDGGAATPINGEKTAFAQSAKLSPDGKHLAYMYFNRANSEKSLQIARFTGDFIGAVENSFEYNLVNLFKWSPDGKSLTYASGEGIPNLWKLPVDGSPPQPITNFKTGRIFNFAWSIDGKRLLITRGIVNNNLVLIRDAAATGN